MANTHKFVTKNGLQTQNISFISPNASNTISVSMLDVDTLSFSGNSGQLFSVTDSLSGTIFAVNDISGIPSIEVLDTGVVKLAENFGNVLIGTAIDDGVNKLQIGGSVVGTQFKSTTVTGTAPLVIASTTLVSNLNVDLLEGQHGSYYLDLSNATGTLSINKGGTGSSTTPTDGQLLIGNGTGYSVANITPGSGISITNGAGSVTIAATGTGVSWVKKTTTYTAVTGDYILADTSGGIFTITLPATPSVGNTVTVADPANWAVNNLTIGRNGSTIEDLAEDMIMDVAGMYVTFTYDGTTWEMFVNASSSYVASGGTTATDGFEKHFLLMGV